MKRVIQWFKGLSRKGKAATIAAVFFVLTGAIGSLGDNKPSSNVQESGLVEVKQSENKELKDKIQRIDEQEAAREKIEQKKQAEEAQTATPETAAPAQTQTQSQTKATTPAAAQTPSQTQQPTAVAPPPSQPTQEQPPAVAPPPPPAPPAVSSDETTIVHITETGSKYHSAGCRYLSKSDFTVTLAQAKARGLTACSVCGPPQ